MSNRISDEMSNKWEFGTNPQIALIKQNSNITALN